MAEIELKNLTKYFEDTKAVEDVNLTIADGEFIVLLGPSGCGKTTTLRLIAGLEEPTKGQVLFDGEEFTHLSPPERNVGMVFQNYMLYPTRTAMGNMEFPLEVKGVSKKERRERVRKVAKLLDIEELLDRKPGYMSGGQRQRVALGRAIVREPHAFLMDEPLANLDAKLRILMRSEIKKLQDELGTTTVYVTHDQVEAMTMGERNALLHDGILHQVGPPAEIYNQPKDAWVAGFIGSPPMNLMPCSMKEEDGKWFLKGDGFSLPLQEEQVKLVREHKTEKKLKVGIRPHNLSVSKEKEPNSIEGELFSKEPEGKEVVINVTVNDYLIKAEEPGADYPASIGDKLYLVPDIKEIYLFDKNEDLLS